MFIATTQQKDSLHLLEPSGDGAPGPSPELLVRARVQVCVGVWPCARAAKRVVLDLHAAAETVETLEDCLRVCVCVCVCVCVW